MAMFRFLTPPLFPCVALLLLIGSSACNRYEMFRLTGYEQVSFSNKVDVLFVVDNSDSMADESAEMMGNFDVFISTLAGSGEAKTETSSLSDAVGNYILYTGDRGRIVDYHVAITTTSNAPAGQGFTTGVDDGEAGTFVGADPVIERGQKKPAHTFQQNVACWATCWHAYEMPTSTNYSGRPGNCPYPKGGATIEYVDCLCTGVQYPNERATWDSTELCGSGQEHHVEPALLAMCRAVDDPPEVCWDHLESNFEEGTDEGTNPDWLRDDSTIVVVMVSDEGDSSPRFDPGDDDPSEYLAAFDEFERDIKFVAIGPDLACDENGDCDLSCNTGGGSINGIRRLINMVEETGGFYSPITDKNCDVADFGKHLQKLGKLLIDLQTSFKLQSIPDETTIRAYVDDEEVARATLPEGSTEDDLDVELENGWSYDPSANAVVFHGEAVPDFNQDVRIFYRPLEGKPRDLPF